MKYPLLEQMRSAAASREREIVKPYKSEIVRLRHEVVSLRSRLEVAESFVKSEVSKGLLEEISAEIASKIRAAILDAAAKAQGRSRSVTVTIPRDFIAFMDPGSIENEILRLYRNVKPDVEFKDWAVSVIELRIPSLSFAYSITEGLGDVRT